MKFQEMPSSAASNGAPKHALAEFETGREFVADSCLFPFMFSRSVNLTRHSLKETPLSFERQVGVLQVLESLNNVSCAVAAITKLTK